MSAQVSAPVGASTYVLVIGRRGMVFGSGLTIREAEMDTLTTLRRIMADDEDVDLSMLLEDMEGVTTLTVTGNNVDAFMYEHGLSHWRLPRPQSQQSEQREND